MPSAVSWLGGPSRTSDLEMRTTFGVHGPKTVDVVILEAAGVEFRRR
jgi:L-lactate dehydrogenase complex protein LldG